MSFTTGVEGCGSALWISLQEMGHPHPSTPVVKDIYTIDSLVNDNTRQLCIRTIDMCFYWFCDRVRQGHYLL